MTLVGSALAITSASWNLRLAVTRDDAIVALQHFIATACAVRRLSGCDENWQGFAVPCGAVAYLNIGLLGPGRFAPPRSMLSARRGATACVEDSSGRFWVGAIYARIYWLQMRPMPPPIS